MSHHKTIAIIGAGIGGLTAAAQLASKGFKVSVFDTQSGPGGKAFTKTEMGFRFDTGPSLMTMLPYFDEHFRSCGYRRQDFFEVTPLTDLCRYFFSDGTNFVSKGTIETMIDALVEAKFETRKVLQDFFSYARKIFEIAGPLFLENSLHDFKTMFSFKTFKSLLRFPSIDSFRTMTKALHSFFKNPKTIQLFQRYATYNGSNPFQVPGTFNMIPFVEYSGTWSLNDGIYSIPLGLEKLAKNLGVVFHYNQTVTKILTKGRRIAGVEVDHQPYEFDAVISNADVLRTYELLNDSDAPMAKRYRKLEPSSSGVVFYWGMNKEFSKLGLHNIIFSNDYKREFDQIFIKKEIPEDPTIYINITSKTTKSDAPDGKENWFVLINTPPNKEQNWAHIIKDLRARIIKRIDSALGCSLEDSIEHESFMSPLDLEKMTGSPGGSLYGISSNSMLAGFLRHSNRSSRWKGLYLCGGSAHPGGGMPLALQSGRIAADLLAKDLKIKNDK